VKGLQEFKRFDSQAQAKRNVVRAIENVAQRLGNTPSVCRKCYIHPAVMDSYLDGSMLATARQKAADEINHSLRRLQAEEAAVLALLEQRLARDADQKDLSKALAASLAARRPSKRKR